MFCSCAWQGEQCSIRCVRARVLFRYAIVSRFGLCNISWGFNFALLKKTKWDNYIKFHEVYWERILFPLTSLQRLRIIDMRYCGTILKMRCEGNQWFTCVTEVADLVLQTDFFFKGTSASCSFILQVLWIWSLCVITFIDGTVWLFCQFTKQRKLRHSKLRTKFTFGPVRLDGFFSLLISLMHNSVRY